MKNGQISRPIRVPFGYVIVKLNKKVSFSEANKTAIKANYFNTERTKLFNKYFDGLRKNFRVNVVNEEIIKTLKNLFFAFFLSSCVQGHDKTITVKVGDRAWTFKESKPIPI